jgi:hypothetical protein
LSYLYFLSGCFCVVEQAGSRGKKALSCRLLHEIHLISSPILQSLRKIAVMHNSIMSSDSSHRVTYNEWQPETLYYRTLITRVDIALHNAFRSDGQRLTVAGCPGYFNSYDPCSIGGRETIILPDWIVIAGTHTPDDINFPQLEQLPRQGRIVAVRDTKLVRQQSNASAVNERIQYKELVDGTHSCHRGYLTQVQHYARMLRTCFGFVLTNKELVLAQFLREEEAIPRLHRQWGSAH